MIALAAALQRNTTVKKIRLGSNNIRQSGCVGLSPPTLTSSLLNFRSGANNSTLFVSTYATEVARCDGDCVCDVGSGVDSPKPPLTMLQPHKVTCTRRTPEDKHSCARG